MRTGLIKKNDEKEIQLQEKLYEIKDQQKEVLKELEKEL